MPHHLTSSQSVRNTPLPLSPSFFSSYKGIVSQNKKNVFVNVLKIITILLT
jgi:hypothetical protein